jgi:hypothetical protein
MPIGQRARSGLPTEWQRPPAPPVSPASVRVVVPSTTRAIKAPTPMITTTTTRHDMTHVSGSLDRDHPRLGCTPRKAQMTNPNRRRAAEKV